MGSDNPNQISVSGIPADYVYNYRTRTFCAEYFVGDERCVVRASTIPDLKRAMARTLALFENLPA